MPEGATRDLIVNGITPPPPEKPASGKKENPSPAVTAPPEPLVLHQPGLSKEPFTKNIERKRNAAVVIQKGGFGSGFFITKQGHILTAAYNVGDARRVRITTANREQKLVARVLRTDKVRNVALLKLEEIPQGFDMTTLPIRTGWPAVGEDVYAVTSPKIGRRPVPDTVSKGIISALRRDMKLDGIRQNYLQADVAIHKGSTGGMLVDKNGNIIGLAQGLYLGPENTGLGLNYFIPVGEALKALDIKLENAGKPVSLIP